MCWWTLVTAACKELRAKPFAGAQQQNVLFGPQNPGPVLHTLEYHLLAPLTQYIQYIAADISLFIGRSSHRPTPNFSTAREIPLGVMPRIWPGILPIHWIILHWLLHSIALKEIFGMTCSILSLLCPGLWYSSPLPAPGIHIHSPYEYFSFAVTPYINRAWLPLRGALQKHIFSAFAAGSTSPVHLFLSFFKTSIADQNPAKF